MEKIIFLDIDGVLNHRASFKKRGSMWVWDNKCVSNLNKIIKETCAKIVISSTWRLHHKDKTYYTKKIGINGEIIGFTPDLFHEIRDTQRGDEIQMWLDEYKKTVTFVILDDDNDMRDLINRLIQTSFSDGGLTVEKTNEAIKLLLGE